jgi:hypothetical protein
VPAAAAAVGTRPGTGFLAGGCNKQARLVTSAQACINLAPGGLHTLADRTQNITGHFTDLQTQLQHFSCLNTLMRLRLETALLLVKHDEIYTNGGLCGNILNYE